MRGLLLLARLHLLACLRGPVLLALGAWVLLAVLALPVAQQASLSAGDRLAVDLGALGLRLAWDTAAFALGAAALGPVLRRGEIRLLLAHGLSAPAWVALRLASALLALLIAVGLGVLLLLGGLALLGIHPPPHLLAWTWLALLEVGIVFGLASVCGTALRGAAGPVLTLVWLLVGRVGGASAAWTSQAVGLVAPDLLLLDAQAALLGSAPAPDLLLPTLYGGGWVLGSLGVSLALATRLARGQDA